MRHGNKVNHLGRKSGHIKAMLSNMACSLIEHKRITTTLAKAKTLRVYVEPILTKAKDDSTHSRRVVFSYLQNKEVVAELFRDVAPKIINRNGGYTRIIRTGNRLGDNAEMCLLELVDFNELYTKDTTKKTTRRSRRAGGKKTGDNDLNEAPAEAVEEAVIIEDNVETEVQNENTAEDTYETSPVEAVSETPVEADEVAVVEENQEPDVQNEITAQEATETITEAEVTEATPAVSEEELLASEEAAESAETESDDTPQKEEDSKEESAS